VLLRPVKFLVILALVAATGLHWAALQTVAWTTMLADNLHTHSFSQAVAQTFDGRHPCSLCKAIAAGKKSSRKNEFTLQMQELKFPPVKENVILSAPSRFGFLPPANDFAKARSRKPLLPPPRGPFV